MINTFLICLFLLFHLSTTNFCYSQSWIPVSPITSSTDYIYAMATAPNGDIYASVWANGAYKSSNLGINWTLSGLSGKESFHL